MAAALMEVVLVPLVEEAKLRAVEEGQEASVAGAELAEPAWAAWRGPCVDWYCPPGRYRLAVVPGAVGPGGSAVAMVHCGGAVPVGPGGSAAAVVTGATARATEGNVLLWGVWVTAAAAAFCRLLRSLISA